MPTRTAYLIAGISKEGKFLGYDIFSSRNPATNGQVVLALVHSESSETYGGARTKLLAYMARVWPWIEVAR